MNYILGLDIGIGSIGWAVLNLDKKRIEDLGVRIFESGEVTNNNKQERKSQIRRRYRSERRMNRRRSHRKMRLKNHLEQIKFTTVEKINEYFENCNTNIIEIRYKAINEKVTPEELAACLINICNGRGYRDFYETDEEMLSKEELKEYESQKESLSHISSLMENGGYRSVADMIYNDPEFIVDGSDFRKYHNSESSDKTNLIPRNMLEKEVDLILKTQKEFYDSLTDENIDKIKEIIFSQRDFEDGPGDPKDKYRKYKGFLDSLGKCRFYTNEVRGKRTTLLSDVYALVNTLSQYHYYDKDGEFCFNSEIASDLLKTALENGNMTKKDVNSVAKKYGLKINDTGVSDTPVTKCFKYIKTVKPIFEKYGFDWSELVKDYSDIDNNMLNQIGILLSDNITPKRRKNKLEEYSNKLAEGLDPELINKLTLLKFSGTSNVSFRYMNDSVEAFTNGDIYGRFQAEIIKNTSNSENENNKKSLKLPPFKNEDDNEFYNNPVVFRAINETRKIINAIVNKYGSPCAVNLETADEVNRSFEDRRADTSRNIKNEKENDRIRKEISKYLNISETAVKPVMVERYKLWESQEHKCLYSGEPIQLEDILNDKGHLLEIDHIVPFSLILDNTLNNKALVLASENQYKKQRTPLMYLIDSDKRKGYISRVNAMYKAKNCSSKKYQYLMLENLDDSELLSEWKSRNLNDTRYISKYLVNYIRNNLQMNTSEEMPGGLSIKNNSRVFAVKSKFVSNFRRQWLNPKTWGRYDKGELKKITYLDHAADAVVIANCRPEYVILSGEKMKLYNIYKNSGKKYTDEYKQSFNNCVESLNRYYGMDKEEIKRLLNTSQRNITPIVPDLLDEVDNRLRDYNTHRVLFEAEKDTDEEILTIFKNRNRVLYSDDPEFADSLSMPVISYKQEKKYSGEITDEKAISVKSVNGELNIIKRKSINEVTCSDIPKLYTGDTALKESLIEILSGKNDKYTVADYLKENNLTCFKTKTGTILNKVSIISGAPKRFYTKENAPDNKTALNDRKYYCVELYKNSEGKNNMNGIAMSDIINKNKKLWLKTDYSYPMDYNRHIMYLFKGDYIRIYDSKNHIKFEGYYMSVKSINRNLFYGILDNRNNKNIISISQNDKCIKLSVDILGKVSGYNNGEGIKCGEPLSLLEVKK